MDHFHNGPEFGEDYFTYPQFYSTIINGMPSGSHFVEIGSWKGKSAAYMAVEIINSGKNIKFDCVDTWTGSEEHAGIKEVTEGTLYETFLRNTERVKHIINPIRMDSVAAAETYANGSLDFVFIDGDHSYEGVRRDILAYLPKMKHNSIISGHDYAWHEPIQRAVKEIFGPNNRYDDPFGNGCWVVKCL